MTLPFPAALRPFLPVLSLAILPVSHAGEPMPPKQPVPPPPAPVPDNGWKFRLEPYGWGAGIDGTVGALGLDTDVEVPLADVVAHLDMAAALQFEARKGRWGMLVDGFFVRLSAGGSTPGAFYSTVNAELEEFIGEGAVTYRLWEGEKGYLDLLAGARYTNLSLDISAEIDRPGIQQVSEGASEQIVDGVVNRGTAIVAKEAGIAADKLQAKLAKEVARRLSEEWVQLPEDIRDFLRRPAVKEALKDLAQEQADLARLAAQERLAPVKSSLQRKLQKRLDRAKANLAKALNREIQARLPESVSSSKGWLDPFVGFRAQWDISSKFFLNARGDVGGFGVGSDLTWTAQATLGYNFSRSIYSELGYKYLAVDYSSGGFTYDVAMAGVYAGLGFGF